MTYHYPIKRKQQSINNLPSNLIAKIHNLNSSSSHFNVMQHLIMSVKSSPVTDSYNHSILHTNYEKCSMFKMRT
ncbi:hypothetical protein EB796_011609 [Bugula neritina]|uniref:Uncharacterized protein n=1 Tax=Bugula neritina TaxID=10212 RepID=A0A7J7JXK0_BUGNE|nr:hypothetical protein EB796_011609 [Bugula neritina]